MNNYDMDVVLGALISDAGIGPVHSGYAMQISQSDRVHVDWLQTIKQAMINVGIYVSDKYPRIKVRLSRGKPYEYCTVVSSYSHSQILAKLYEEWYKSGRKEVPSNFKMTRVSLAGFFMGDGSSSYHFHTMGAGASVSVVLATHGYTEESVTIIERELWRMRFSTSRTRDKRVVNGAGIGISILGNSVEEFMDTIALCVEPSFRYKIKYPVNTRTVEPEAFESILINEEGLDAVDAKAVAAGLIGKTHDVRDAIRVARLSKRIGVERALQLFLK